MAKVSLTLDDVIYAFKSKKVAADDTATLNIPALMSSTGKRRLLRIDVSDKGKTMLDDAVKAKDKALTDAEAKYEEGLEKLKADYEKDKKAAWKDLNGIADKLDEHKIHRNRTSKNDVEATETVSTEATDVVSDTEPTSSSDVTNQVSDQTQNVDQTVSAQTDSPAQPQSQTPSYNSNW